MANESTPYFWHETNLFRAFKEAGFEPRSSSRLGHPTPVGPSKWQTLFPTARFHLFEPLVDHKDFYRENTARILQLRPDFRIHKIAVGDVDGTIKMGVDASGYSASTLVTEP